jgi:glycerophosphoryl diester phosphodiesterase
VEKRSSTLSFDTPFLVIAHRGDSTRAPENTLSAFRKAIEARANMIELDVQLTADGVLVVFHDMYLQKHSSGEGLLSDFTIEEIRKLDAGSWFSNGFKGETIPLLSEVLELAKDRILLNIEIKPEAVTENSETGIERRVCDTLQSFEMEEQALISSFDYRVLDRVCKINPALKTGLLYNRKKSGGLSPVQLVKKYRAYSFHCSRWQIRKKWINECRINRVPVYVYTVNGKRAMRSLIKKGVKGIFSDKPAQLKEVSGVLLKR